METSLEDRLRVLVAGVSLALDKRSERLGDRRLVLGDTHHRREFSRVDFVTGLASDLATTQIYADYAPNAREAEMVAAAVRALAHGAE